MDSSDPTGGFDGARRISRRRLLRWIPGALAGASAGKAGSVHAMPYPPESGVAPPPPPPEGPPPATAPAVSLPFRPKPEAIRACALRRYWEERRASTPATPLESLLGTDLFPQSRVGMVNWPLVDETEDPTLGHFAFPINPFNLIADDGAQQYMFFSNTQVIANFRSREYLEQVHRRIFDRAVWAMDLGRIGTAIVELDRPLGDQKVGYIVRLLDYYGVRTIIWGNELNDPSAPWRDNLPGLFDALSAAAAAKRSGKLRVELSLPGLAYYGQGEYLQKMLSTLRDLQRRRFPAAPNDLPVQRVADHYYGSVDAFLLRVRKMRDIMAAEGMGKLKYDLTEVGNPTADPGQVSATDAQLAEGLVPQIASMAVGSGQVDRVYFYSALDSRAEHSFMSVEDSTLKKKPAYQALVIMAKLLAGVQDASVLDDQGIVRVQGRRTDGIDFQVVWSKAEGHDLWMDLPRGKRVFDPLGQEGKEDRPGQIVLRPKQHVLLGGPARIIVGQGR